MTPRMQVAFRNDVGWNLRYLIARVAGAPIHCVTLYDDTVIDTSFAGVVARTRADRFAEGKWEVIDVPSIYDAERALAFANTRIGWRYDWIGAIASWWMGRSGGSGIRSRLFCSEQCASELRVAGVPLLYDRDAHYTPRKLKDELRRLWPNAY